MKPTGATKEAAMDWLAKPLPVHGYRIETADGIEIVRDVYKREHAEQIVNEHNAVAFAVRQGENWALLDWQNWLRWTVSQSIAAAARAVLNEQQGEGRS